MTRRLRVALAAVAVPASLVAADRDPLVGRVAGSPQRCMPFSTSTTNGPTIADSKTILYRVGARIYRTGPRGACPELRPFSTLIVHVYGSELCRNDRFEVLETGASIPSGTCLFTDFTPYEKAK